MRHKTLKRRSFLGKAWDASVWGANTIPEEDDRARPFLQFVIPPYYLVQVLFAYTGFKFGIPAIYTAINPDFGQIWSLLIMITAIVCMVTATFPKLAPRLVGISNSGYAALQLLYAACLIYLAFFSGDVDGRAADRSATAVRALGGLLIPIWMTYDNARERKAEAL